jgi:hypothetical protein
MPTKKKSPHHLSDHQKAQLNKTRSKGIFQEAYSGETFGPHPGQVDLKIRFSISSAITQSEERLPGQEIELLVSSFDEVYEMRTIIIKALTDWISGLSPYK